MSASIRPSVINFALSRTTIFTPLDRAWCIHRAELSEALRVPIHPLATRCNVKLRSRSGPARLSQQATSSASPLENCPPYFYHITSFLSHLPLPGLVCHHHNHQFLFSLVRLSRLDAIFSDAFPLFSPFLSCPCSFSAVRSYSAFVSPSVSSSPSFLIPPPSSSSFVSWCGLTAETRSCAPPFYLRIVRKAIPHSSFVAPFFPFPHCPFVPLLSRRTLTPPDSLLLLSFSLSFSRKLLTSIPTPRVSCLQHRTRYRPIMTVTG